MSGSTGQKANYFTHILHLSVPNMCRMDAENHALIVYILGTYKGYKKYWPPNKCDIKEAYIIIFLFKSIHIFFLNYM